MKILIRNSDNVVIYAQDDLVLTATQCTGDRWYDNNFNLSNATIVDATIPANWRGAIWTYTGGVWAIHDQSAHDALVAEKYAVESAHVAKTESDRITFLWQAAHDYEYAQVSGSAVGLLAVGVMQGKPKCLAVQGWIKGIWTEYYTRKATGSTDYSFAIAGACPHSVPEIMVELGV